LNNYPNPFNASTLLCFRVKEPGMVSLKVFDMAGRVLESLVNENKPVGDYTVEWNAAGISEGVYFCKLQYGSYMEVQKLLILK
jgi:hypothetical protein